MRIRNGFEQEPIKWAPDLKNFFFLSSNLSNDDTLFFFYKNIFYKNIDAEICEILRIL